MNATDNFRQFIHRCAQGLLRQADTTETSAAAQIFAERVQTAPSRHYTPQSQPVLAGLDQLPQTGFDFGFHHIAAELPWRHSSRTTDEGHDTALGPINEMLDLGDMIAGLLYLDSDRQYPLHQHNPQELYLIMAGHGQWRYGGDQTYRSKQPGEVIYNHPNDLHGINAADTPLLALYLLWP